MTTNTTTTETQNQNQAQNQDGSTVLARVTVQYTDAAQREALKQGLPAESTQEMEIPIPVDILDNARYVQVSSDGYPVINKVYRDAECPWKEETHLRSDKPITCYEDLEQLIAAIVSEQDKRAEKEEEQRVESERRQAEYDLRSRMEMEKQQREVIRGFFSDPNKRGRTRTDGHVEIFGWSPVIKDPDPALIEEIIRRNNADEDRKEKELRTALAWGTPDQRERYEAGVLPVEELQELCERLAFEWAADFRRFVLLTPEDIPFFGETRAEPDFWSFTKSTYTAAEWDMLKRIREAAPSHAKVEVREHNGYLDRDYRGASTAEVYRSGIKVKLTYGGFDFACEFAVAQPDRKLGLEDEDENED